MKLPEPDYISMAEAANKFKVSTEHLRWLTEQQLLPLYGKKGSSYFRILNPAWSLDRIDFNDGYAVDSQGNKISNDHHYFTGSTYESLFIRPNELFELEKNYAAESRYVTDQPKVGISAQTPEEYVAHLRSQNEPDAVIAVNLQQHFIALTGHECMQLLDPKRVKTWEESKAQQGRPKQWFQYLLKKGKKILAERERVTLAES